MRLIAISSVLKANVSSHDRTNGLSTLSFDDGTLKVPLIDAPVGASIKVEISASDVSVALTRPIDVSITNRLPGKVVEIERLSAPHSRVTFALGSARIHALMTWESLDRLALEPGLNAWVMIKTLALANVRVVSGKSSELSQPRGARNSNLVKLPVRR